MIYNLSFVINVSIHAPHEGERRLRPWTTPRIRLFQSTLPTRGSDAAKTWSLCRPHCFNPRSPRGGATLSTAKIVATRYSFNPRSPRGGATDSGILLLRATSCFNPRSPRGGATLADGRLTGTGGVSIHAPHEGERRRRVELQPRGHGVSIHAPHEGERLLTCAMLTCVMLFQSTLPTRGSDASYSRLSARDSRFNPRSPRGGATARLNQVSF